ncbi:hypothetical protein K492DRAFT_238645 [Lichtheimia hyalospora FSU 10163]|nr:hypothetical protein K492DRAFT_238645 [Lichtheimia hyalospora FSU 10163]
MTMTTPPKGTLGHQQHSPSSTIAYKDNEPSADKFKVLKKQIREITQQNEILTKDLSRARKRLRRLAKEKNILLDQLCSHDISKLKTFSKRRVNTDDDDHLSYGMMETNTGDRNDASPPHSSLSSITEKESISHKIPSTTVHRPTPTSVMPISSFDPSQSSQSSSRLSSQQLTSIHRPPPPPPAPPPPTPPPPMPIPPTNQPIMDVMHQNGMVPSSRPKRMRRSTAEPKVRRVQPIEKDPISGEYKLPARVGILTVHSLGRVVPLPTYHNDRYIWPPGFKVSRTYLSMTNPNANTVYTCSVEENGDQGPRFRVVAEDAPDQPIIANSATGVWTAIVKRANEIRNRDHSNSASGPDYYGFTHATIAKMIQDLPGAANCINYVWQTFGEMHQKTAAGVAAASLRKLTNLEIMGSANKRAPQDGDNDKQEEATDTLQVKIEQEPSRTQTGIDSAVKHEATAMQTD